jgi:NADH-quinone oxidoreductase subunit N
MNGIIILGITAIICMYLAVFGLKKWSLLIALGGVASACGMFMTNQLGNWSSYLHNMVAFDELARSYSAVILMVLLLIFWASKYYYRQNVEHLADIYALFLFSAIGAVILVSYHNLVMLFLGVEILSIPMYILAGSNRNNANANEAGLKYFLLGSFASAFLLLGITLIYGVTASFDIQKIATFTSNMEGVSPIYFLGILMVIGSFIFKVAAAPFHFWAPDVYQGSPSVMTSYLATIGKIAVLGALIRWIHQTLPSIPDAWRNIFYIVSFLTMIIGSLSSISQTNMKRLLAYTGIANVGFILLAIVAISDNSYLHILYYFFGYSVATVAAFSIYSTIKSWTGIDTMTGFKGLIINNKLLTVTLIAVMLSYAGIPPLAGFFGKFFIFSDALRAGFVLLTVVAVITSIISAINYIRLMSHTVSNEGSIGKIDLEVDYRLYLVVTLILLIFLGIMPEQFIGWLKF